MKNEISHVNLLWTGGWDSTFQLLQLLLIYKCEVIPYYTAHENRPSTDKEIRVMKSIKDVIFRKYPFTKELLKPTVYRAVGDIEPNEEISNAYLSVLEKCHVGIQYEWLARFCASLDIEEMQLSIQDHIKKDPNHFNLKPLLKPKIIGGQESFIIDPQHKDKAEYGVFRFFSFPLLSVTKVQMNEVVNKYGWGEIMEMTWFCHFPTKSDKPCGVCIPCIIAIDEKFGWRIPVGRRAISFWCRKIWWPFKLYIRAILIKVGLYSEKKKKPLR